MANISPCTFYNVLVGEMATLKSPVLNSQTRSTWLVRSYALEYATTPLLLLNLFLRFYFPICFFFYFILLCVYFTERWIMLRRHQKARGARRRQAHVGQAEAINADNLIFTNKFRVHVLFHTPHAPPLFDGLPLPTSLPLRFQVRECVHTTLSQFQCHFAYVDPHSAWLFHFSNSLFLFIYLFFFAGGYVVFYARDSLEFCFYRGVRKRESEESER